jgi:hypothetical protein
MMTRPFKHIELCKAAADGKVDKVRDLLDKCKTKEHVDDQCIFGFTAFTQAASSEGAEQCTILNMIWNKYKELRCNLKEILVDKDGCGNTVFLCAACSGNKDTTKLILSFYLEVFDDLTFLYKDNHVPRYLIEEDKENVGCSME